MRRNSRKVFLSGLLIVIISFCQSSSADWADVRSIKNKVIHFRSKNYRGLIREFERKEKKGKNLGYAEAFMKAKTHFTLREFRSAAVWFAKSVFYNREKPKKYYPSVVYSYLNSWGNIFRSRSPVVEEALYYTALCYHELGENKYAMHFLDILEDYLSEELEERYTELKARVYAKISPARALKIYENLLEENKKPTYFIRRGSIYHKQEQFDKALHEYFQALEFNKNQWSYKIAARQVADILSKNSGKFARLGAKKKILMAEGYRLLRKISRALSIWNSLKPQNISRKDKYLYLKFSSRFLFDRRKYTEAIRLLKKHSSSLSKEKQDELKHELARRFLRKDRYRKISELISASSENTKLNLIRLQALRKLKSPSREKEAARYLEDHDADSTITERTYFSACLEKYLEEQNDDAEDCLEDLASLTENVSTGGRARYFLGKIEEKKGNFKAARKQYAQVYLNSPSDFYAFKALRKSLEKKDLSLPDNDLEEIRDWLSRQAGDTVKLKKFFARKRQEADYAVDPFWREWEEKLENIDDVSSKLKKGILFIGMGFDDLAVPYTKDLEQIQRLLVYQKAGHLVHDPYLKYVYLKRYIIKKKKSIDVFTLSKAAQASLYPTPYQKYIKEASRRFGVEKERLYALMKQESSFHPGLRSGAGATGVMQVMPSTARWLNKKLKLGKLNLTNPRQSILLGTKFYADVSQRYSKNFEDIAIAYNAGPGRLIKWRKSIPTADRDIFLERIPFRETNLYVKRTRRYYDRYKVLSLF